MTWIGSHLRSLRIERGLEQREVAERMHCTPSTVSHLETKGADVRMSTVVRYCDAIGARIHIGLPAEEK